MEVKYYERVNQYGYLRKYAMFNGIEFYQRGDYFDNKEHRYLHRYIYKFFYGPIPKGYHIHHKDFNKTNNDINNLQILTCVEHSALHSKGNKVNVGREPVNKIKRTPTMYTNINNGMSCKEFMKKYKCKRGLYYHLKWELKQKELIN